MRIDSETGAPTGGDNTDYFFFQDLALQTGGQFFFMEDSSTPSGACCDAIERCRDGSTADGCTASGGEYRGDGTLCENIEPCVLVTALVPATSTWGVVCGSLLLMCVGSVLAGSQRAAGLRLS